RSSPPPAAPGSGRCARVRGRAEVRRPWAPGWTPPRWATAPGRRRSPLPRFVWATWSVRSPCTSGRPVQRAARRLQSHVAHYLIFWSIEFRSGEGPDVALGLGLDLLILRIFLNFSRHPFEAPAHHAQLLVQLRHLRRRGDAHPLERHRAQLGPSLPHGVAPLLHPGGDVDQAKPRIGLPDPPGDLLQPRLAPGVDLGEQALRPLLPAPSEAAHPRKGRTRVQGRLRSIVLHGFHPHRGVVDTAAMFRLLHGILFLFPPERAHALAAAFLRWLGRIPRLAARVRRRMHRADPRLHVRCCGLDFPSPVGVAAGFDKGDGLAAGLFALGFGAVEVGTITPRPQPGNPRPRLFRLPRQRALINRMGFNNAGAAATARRYAGLRFRPGPLGFNLGKNKDTPQEEAARDYLDAFEALKDIGDYFVVNVSSPNTPGLRALQSPEALRAILLPLVERAGRKPVFLKLAPDLADEDVDEIADLALSWGVAGLILANTTVGRPGAEG